MFAQRKTIFLLVILAALVSAGCDAVPHPNLPQASPTATAVRNVLATRPMSSPITASAAPTLLPAPPPQSTATAMQTQPASPTSLALPPTDSGLGFCCLQFAGGPYGPVGESFPGGTEIVYAVWDYAGLTPADRIRRIWLRDGLIWITRDEAWDWDKYGSNGTVRDLSIFDYEGDGLQSGEYRLQLYLNDVLQQESAFVILPP